jgi:glycosyltransferase involved in cell wall biosynthesis
VTRNGIDPSRFDKKVERNKYKCVNSSSPDRSWPVLLDCWPHIKALVPNAELHLYYGFENWKKVAAGYAGQPELIAQLEQQIKNMSAMGVVYHGRINQNELANEFLSAGAWIFPSWFVETSCISAMEAHAAGLRMITSGIGALNETVGIRGVLIDGNWVSMEYKEQFIQSVVRALRENDGSDRIALQAYAKEHFSLDRLAKDWEQMFATLISQKITVSKSKQPLKAYKPTKAYR